MTDLRLTPQEIKAAIDNADYSSVIDGGVLRPNIQQDIDRIKARAIQSALLAKLSGVKIEAARKEGEQAGMRKFYTFLRSNNWKWVNDDGKHIEIGLMTEELQSFIQKNGLGGIDVDTRGNQEN